MCSELKASVLWVCSNKSGTVRLDSELFHVHSLSLILASVNMAARSPGEGYAM